MYSANTGKKADLDILSAERISEAELVDAHKRAFDDNNKSAGKAIVKE